MVSEVQIALGSLLVAATLWMFIFLIPPFRFWILLASSTLVLLLIAVLASRGAISISVSGKLLVYGIVSAALLYGLFYFGYQATKPIPIFSQGVSHIYALRLDEPPLVIALLLIFPIGFSEELYWRGLIQRTISSKWGNRAGIGLASIAYCLVHIPTFNVPLIFAALIGGLAWGGLYALTKDLTPGIVSHIIWSIMIFVLLPLR
ncbi:MAG: lysostaphin resistance A-like protein [Candidatus Bathyarchaeia archaeon]